MAYFEKIIHRPAHARTRKEARETYAGYEIKRDVKNEINYANVQSMYSCFYGGIDPRRRTEMADGGMVKEDRQAMSNLPTKGYQRQYPSTGYYSNPYIQTSLKDEREE